MEFGFDERTEELRTQVREFMDELVFPNEPVLAAQIEEQRGTWREPPVIFELQREARARGLWNLFLPKREGGAGLTNLQYAPLAELMGHSPALAPSAFNCAAPDTGNMELLAEFGSPEQQATWLKPLLDAQIRSAFCMTEPDVASSDAANISTSITRDGDDYVINGRKWFSTGAMNPECAIFIVMGKTDPTAAEAPPAEHDPGAAGHPGRRRPARHAGVRQLRLRSRRPRRDPVHRCPGAGDQPHRRRGHGLRDRPGPARPRPHPPLHAGRSAWPSGRCS